MNKCILNERTEKTKKVIHLMVTPLCNRDCEYCCNKQYSLDDIPRVTDEELMEAEVLCLTGGEPFAFTNPCEIAKYYKQKYPNIKKVYVYTNAYELYEFIRTNMFTLSNIDGLSVSIKNKRDKTALEILIKEYCYYWDIIGNNELTSNRLYDFLGEEYNTYITSRFKVIKREWQKNFVPADDSIFRTI